MLIGLALAPAFSGNAQPSLNQQAIVKSEFIFERASFASSHNSSIAETHLGLVTAFMGGSREGALDASIWVSRFDGREWSAPNMVAHGVNEAERIRHPCWSPVLFQPRFGPLYLFYKVGPSPATWWGMVMSSTNGGQTWSKPRRLPSNIFGPARNKPVELQDGLVLSGSSSQTAGWRVHIERSRAPLRDWNRTDPLNSALEFAAIQPTVLVHPSGHIQILCRTRQGRITQAWSQDSGVTWGRMTATELPNPNSAIDAVVLRDERIFLAYNHSIHDRSTLNLAVSEDGARWEAAMILENSPGDEFSSPAIIQASSGMMHITYTWNRTRIKHVVVNPFKMESTREIVQGQWPSW